MRERLGLTESVDLADYVRGMLEVARLGTDAGVTARLACEERAKVLSRAERDLAQDVLHEERERVRDEVNASTSRHDLYARDRRHALRVAVNTRSEVVAAGEDPEELTEARESLREAQMELAAIRASRPKTEGGRALAVARVAGTMGRELARELFPSLTPAERRDIQAREIASARSDGERFAAMTGLDGEIERRGRETEEGRMAIVDAVTRASLACCAELGVASETLLGLDGLRPFGFAAFDAGVDRLGAIEEAEGPFLTAMILLSGIDEASDASMRAFHEGMSLRDIVGTLDPGERAAYRATLATMTRLDADMTTAAVGVLQGVAATAGGVMLGAAFTSLKGELDEDPDQAMAHVAAEAALAR